MAAVHSAPNPPQGLLGAYRCLICQFCSPLYSELVRHYNEYHSRSGWLLCPLCLRVFSFRILIFFFRIFFPKLATAHGDVATLGFNEPGSK